MSNIRLRNPWMVPWSLITSDSKKLTFNAVVIHYSLDSIKNTVLGPNRQY